MNNILKGARMNAPDRKQKILNAAIQLSISKGYQKITRKDVAMLSGSATGLINHYFKGMENLRDEILKEAVAHEILPILAETLLDKRIHCLSAELKKKVIQYLNN